MRGRTLGILCVAAAVAASPARAAMFSGSGSLDWRFDDIHVRDGAGRRKRSAWHQGYRYDVQGPLAHRVLGSLRTGLRFSEGADINQAVNTESPSRRVLAWSGAAELFRPGLRRTVRFQPNGSWSETRQAGAQGGASRRLRSASWGYSGGLSLPRLPVVNVSRHHSRRTDPSTLSPVEQDSTRRTETVGWSKGPLRLRFEHEEHELHDRLSATGPSEDDFLTGSAELNFYELKRLQSLAWRLDARRLSADGNPTQKSLLSDFSFRTKESRRGEWGHSWGGFGNFERDQILETTNGSLRGDLNSRRDFAGRAALTNTFSAGASGGVAPSQSLSEGINVSLGRPAGRLTGSLGVSGGWSRRAGSGPAYSDSLIGRLVAAPRLGTSWTSSLSTTGLDPRASATAFGYRAHRLESLLSLPLLRAVRADLRYDLQRRRDFREGTVSWTEVWSARGTGSPLPGMELTGGWEMQRLRDSRGFRSLSRTLSAAAAYRLRSGLTVSGSLVKTDQGLNSGATLGWMLGKTRLSLSYERRELSTPATFSHWSAALSRSL